MGNQHQLLVLTEQHNIDNRFIVIEVYKGQVSREAKYERYGKSYERVVQFKAFSIMISEIVMVNGAPVKLPIPELTFPYCASRTGDFKYAVKCMKEQCKSIRDIEFLMADLRERFNVALNRDAERTLKRDIGLLVKEPSFTVTIQTKDFPLPQKK